MGLPHLVMKWGQAQKKLKTFFAICLTRENLCYTVVSVHRLIPNCSPYLSGSVKDKLPLGIGAEFPCRNGAHFLATRTRSPRGGGEKCQCRVPSRLRNSPHGCRKIFILLRSSYPLKCHDSLNASALIHLLEVSERGTCPCRKQPPKCLLSDSWRPRPL